jgi:hypothetical protein
MPVTRRAVLVLGVLGPAACTYAVPDVAAPDATAVHVDSSVLDAPGETGEASTGMDGGRVDTSVPGEAASPDSAQRAESGPQDGAAESQASDGSACTGPIAWKETTKFTVNGSATFALPTPTSIAPGDVLLAYLVAYFPGGGPAQMSLDPPQGWTLNGNAQEPGYYQGSSAIAVYRHVAAAGEPTSYVFTANRSAEVIAWILDYTGVSNTSPVDGHSSGSQNPTLMPFPTPSITATGPGDLIIATFTTTTSPIAAGWVVPAGMTSRAALSDNMVLTGASDDELQAGPGGAGPFDSVPQGGGLQINTVLTHVIALHPCL